MGTEKLDFSTIETNIHYPIKIYSSEYLEFILDALTQKVHETEEKDEVLKDLDLMENILKFSV